MMLATFRDAGVLDDADVQVGSALLRIAGSDDEQVGLAAALCVRALRSGSVCLDLAEDPSVWLPEDVDHELPWPQPDQWLAAVRSSPLVDGPMHLSGSLLYLRRYWQDEQLVRDVLRERSVMLSADVDDLARLFDDPGPDLQRLAAATAALRQVTIVAGGPGTGKTTTVARILALLLREPLTVALAAPTGKAAARLQEAVAQAVAGMDVVDQARVGELPASTLHRLLGWRPDSRGRFRHDRANPLPHDVVIVDETSMVSLPLMARLLEAVRPDARLILVGDPDQLASVEAGVVLGDLVAAPGPPDPELAARLAELCPAEAHAAQRASAGVVVLERNYRFDGAIAQLAAAIRDGDADAALRILEDSDEIEFLDPEDVGSVRRDVISQAKQIRACAAVGDTEGALDALETHRVLCAHREGAFGVAHWDALIGDWTATHSTGPWYVGQPLLVTANDPVAGIYNGDTGVIVDVDGELRAAFGRGVLLPLSQLDAAQTLRALTVHRGQGSQFDAVTVVLPPAESPLLTRELLYTAVTRARQRIRVLGTTDAVRAGVQRQVRRASGLRLT